MSHDHLGDALVFLMQAFSFFGVSFPAVIYRKSSFRLHIHVLSIISTFTYKVSLLSELVIGFYYKTHGDGALKAHREFHLYGACSQWYSDPLIN